MKIKNIKWDTDGDKKVLAHLPKEVEIPKDMSQSNFDDQDEWLDAIADWLSDEYGFCHFGFDVE